MLYCPYVNSPSLKYETHGIASRHGARSPHSQDKGFDACRCWSSMVSHTAYDVVCGDVSRFRWLAARAVRQWRQPARRTNLQGQLGAVLVLVKNGALLAQQSMGSGQQLYAYVLLSARSNMWAENSQFPWYRILTFRISESVFPLALHRELQPNCAACWPFAPLRPAGARMSGRLDTKNGEQQQYDW